MKPIFRRKLYGKMGFSDFLLNIFFFESFSFHVFSNKKKNKVFVCFFTHGARSLVRQLEVVRRSQLVVVGRSQLEVVGRSQLVVVGRIQLEVVRRSQLEVVGRSQLEVLGRSQLVVVGRIQL